MTFILSKLLWTVLNPSSLTVIALCVGLAGAWRGRRGGLVLASVAAAGLVTVGVLPVDQWALRPLEDRFPAMTRPPAHVDGIIVLGGALDTPLSEAHGQPALNEAAERMTRFVALAREYPDARLAFTGGSGLLTHGALSEADVAAQLLGQLGLDRAVTYENRSRNTYENALFLRRLVHPVPGESWILVTSASHMPRAVGVFRAQGWPVIPWPVGYKTGSLASIRYGHALPTRLAQLDWAMHEWVGLVAYRLMGRTSALFPAPAPTPPG